MIDDTGSASGSSTSLPWPLVSARLLPNRRRTSAPNSRYRFRSASAIRPSRSGVNSAASCSCVPPICSRAHQVVQRADQVVLPRFPAPFIAAQGHVAFPGRQYLPLGSPLPIGSAVAVVAQQG